MAYKGYYINGYCDRDAVTVVSHDHTLIRSTSLHAAKCLITRLVNS